MAVPIIPRVIRGRLHFEIGPVLLPTFAQAAVPGSAAACHRLDVVDRLHALTVRRAVALVDMRGAGADLLRFRTAARREAFLAAEIRPLHAEVPSHG